MNIRLAKQSIIEGRTVLGIEFGSTRIKGVLLDDKNQMLASGGHGWENRLEDGVWTYHLEDVWEGVQDCFKDLNNNVKELYGVELETIGALGISAMMHGYLAFNTDGELLVPFRTWRNTMTEPASIELMKLFKHQIPQRWSIAHLYQSILNNEEHVKDVAYITTLSGYIHWMLTGEKVLGVGDASGMFPIDAETKSYYEDMLDKFDDKVSDKDYTWKIREILPKPLTAGEEAGILTEEGARLLDPSGKLKAGIPMCPPEGDAGTGMVATNSVKVRTGNVSAGTSVFSMIVLEKKLSKVYPEIDIVTTPEGNSVAMVHCNNCTSDLNSWVNLFKECLETFGVSVDVGQLYGGLYNKALEGDKDCGGLMAYNYISGEHITHMSEGRPLFVREQNCKFSLANFMRSHLYTAFGAIKVGNDLLFGEEGVKVDVIWGHGGIFKTEGVAQNFLAAALNTPVSVMKTAGEGGAWGIAILAAYMLQKGGVSLCDYLENIVFKDAESTTIVPDPEDVKGYEAFIERYKNGLAVEKAAVDNL
ncbi:MAG: FGGY-family carbohydrate kinase [Schaedlerella sp.]|nr:FGGY-family carbohydrate kinase [Schaedlerella sp.]